MLRRLRAISAKQEEHDRKFDEVITFLGALERDVAGMKKDFAGKPRTAEVLCPGRCCQSAARRHSRAPDRHDLRNRERDQRIADE